jgi:hypothetical protein
MEIRLEDVGKMIVENQTTLEKQEVLDVVKKFFEETGDTRNYLLLSKEIDYYTVFQIESESVDKAVDNFWDFLSDSFFIKAPDTETNFSMTDIKLLEINEDLNHLELWIAGTYFQLSTFDWGVEKL